ncbi:NAD(P)H-dependent oxidoreductase [Clostridia bacterium]|nr:NAD(P)H-dependent oxidoreductase [Clostridia bacterium]
MNKKEQLLEAYDFRFACKEFDREKKISEEDFEFILETARLSPSSFGWEPWKFIVVQNMELREKLKEYSWGALKQLPTASHFVLLLARKAVDTKAGSDYLTHIANDVQQLPQEVSDMKMEFFKNFQQGDFDLTDERKLFDWASKQVYIALANMLTAAAYMGIDSCPIEGFNRQKVETLLHDEGIVDTEEFGLAVMAAFGYKSEDVHMHGKTRQELDDIVEWIR